MGVKLYEKGVAVDSGAADAANDTNDLADITTKGWQIGSLGRVMSFGECTDMSMKGL